MFRTLFAAAAVAALSAPTLLPPPAAANEIVLEAEQQHAAWTEILQKYVVEGADGLNSFDYGGLKNNAADSAKLDAYLASFADLDFDALSRDEAFVAWANLYNALTIQHMIGRYPVASIRSGYFLPPFGPWKSVSINAGGRDVTLDEIEHGILRADWSEPRVHYMVNCASIGCPNLKSTAWEVATLEDDLDAAAEAYINHPRGVTIRNNGTLQVSTIYKWFRVDFGDSNDGVIEHLLEYASDDLAEAIESNPRITKHAYDWDLNDAS